MTKRVRIVACNSTQLMNDNGDGKEEVTKQRHRVLQAYAKSHKKWFVAVDEQVWSKDMKEDELNKHR